MQNDNTPTLTMEYILGKLDQISNDTAYLHETIAALQGMKHESGEAGSPGDIAGKEKAQALGSAVKSRETTNQQLIALYTKMYEDIKAPINDYKTGQLRQILESFCEAEEYMLPSMEKVALRMLGLPTE